MGKLHFEFKLVSKGMERIPEIHARLQDFRVPFNHILQEWADGNALKFAAGEGAEQTGITGGDLAPATWFPLSEKYFKSKHNISKTYGAFPDSLMVRTGALRDALCSLKGFDKYVAEHTMNFGQPLNEAENDKAKYNKELRPTVFLSQPDKNMIRRNLTQYLNLGGDYKALMFAQSAQKADMEKGWDVDFPEAR
jgi:hypothetical protein